MILLVLLSIPDNFAFASRIIIIAHPGIPNTILKKSDLKKIYLGDITTWEDGKKIDFSVIRTGPVHELFLKTYIDKSPVLYTRHWKRQLLTGKKAKLPRLFTSEKKVIDFISKTEGGIGYVSSVPPDCNLKIIKIIE